MVSLSDQFDALYAEFLTKTRVVQMSILHDHDLLAEAQQLLWLGIWNHIQSHGSISTELSYFCQSARNVALDVRRAYAKANRDTVSLDELMDIKDTSYGFQPVQKQPDPPMDSELKAALIDAVNCLPPRERQVVTLYYLCEQSTPEIAAELFINISAVTMALSRGMAKLRSYSIGAQKAA